MQIKYTQLLQNIWTLKGIVHPNITTLMGPIFFFLTNILQNILLYVQQNKGTPTGLE